MQANSGVGVGGKRITFSSDIRHFSDEDTKGGHYSSFVASPPPPQPVNSTTSDKYSEIESRLLIACKEKLARLKKEKKENHKDVVVQPRFCEFLKSKDFSRLITSIYDYCTDLNKIEKKHRILEEEAKDRINAPPQLLASEVQRIAVKAKDCSLAYSVTLLHWGNLKDRNKDQNFFDCMITMVERILEDFFDRQDYPKVKEEINRLFRTNTFNTQKRRHIVDSYIRQYPQMMQSTNLKKEPPSKIIEKVESRFNVPALNVKVQMNIEKSEIRPMFIKNTPCGSYKARSPLVALIYPSTKEKLFNYNIEQKKRQLSAVGQRRILNENDVSFMIRHDRSNNRQRANSFHTNQPSSTAEHFSISHNTAQVNKSFY